jgi:hypothetical protein
MKYEEYEKALSVPRVGKYLIACKGDKNKALILYRYNIKLCQKIYGRLGVLEVVLRNAINDHFKTTLNDCNWLIAEAKPKGFLANYQKTILNEYDELLKNGRYTHDKLLSSLSFGVWVFMFSKTSYRKSGQTLLHIFPDRTHGLNQSNIHKDLDKIRKFRNRMAHHEPLCFDNTGKVNVAYVGEIYFLLEKYIRFMGYNTNELLYGVDDPYPIIMKIEALSKTI